MVATINMADMALGKEPRHRWGRCAIAGWKYTSTEPAFLAFTDPEPLPAKPYSRLYEAMQIARAARF